MAKHKKTKLNNYEQIRDHSIVPEIDTRIRASKENAIGVENTDTRVDENKHINNQVIIDKKLIQLGKKIESKPKNRFKL
jgi:hypothetical protein